MGEFICNCPCWFIEGFVRRLTDLSLVRSSGLHSDDESAVRMI